MKHTVIAIDIAKNVFQLHWVEAESGRVERLKLKRAQLLSWFAKRQPATVLMETCGGAHEWGRRLQEQGHEVRLLSAQAVRPFVLRNKTDAADAQGIWTAGQQPTARFVAVKTEAQQVTLSLHRVRSQLMKMRIMQTNELRGLLAEFGIVLPEGHRALMEQMPAALAQVEQRLPAVLLDTLREQVRRIDALQADIVAIERRLTQQLKQTPAAQRLMQIPGVGLLIATAAVATMGSPAAFSSARQFAAWVGLVPKQTGTGGRVRQLGISKRGDVYLRTSLMHGARALLNSKAATTWPWLIELLKRRPKCVAIAALANKIARTIWAVLSKNQPWRAHAWQAA